jgi:hypothetical protein
MTQTQLRHLDISLCHPRPGLAQKELSVQPNSTDQFQSPLSSVTRDLLLLTDRRCKSSLADSKKDTRGVFGGRGDEELKQRGKLLRDDTYRTRPYHQLKKPHDRPSDI